MQHRATRRSRATSRACCGPRSAASTSTSACPTRSGDPRLQRHSHPHPPDQRPRGELALLVWRGLRARERQNGDLPQLSACRDGSGVRRLRPLHPGHPRGLHRRRGSTTTPTSGGTPEFIRGWDGRDPGRRYAIRPAAGGRARRTRPLPHPPRGGAGPVGIPSREALAESSFQATRQGSTRPCSIAKPTGSRARAPRRALSRRPRLLPASSNASASWLTPRRS